MIKYTYTNYYENGPLSKNQINYTLDYLRHRRPDSHYSIEETISHLIDHDTWDSDDIAYVYKYDDLDVENTLNYIGYINTDLKFIPNIDWCKELDNLEGIKC